MVSLADVLVYLEVYADDSALIRLQESEIPRIRRQRNAAGSSRCEGAENSVVAVPNSTKS
jgi:hypothetical protein